MTTSVTMEDAADATFADRTVALASWKRDHDHGDISAAALNEAAVVAPVAISADGPTFDTVRFRELAQFIAELPF